MSSYNDDQNLRVMSCVFSRNSDSFQSQEKLLKFTQNAREIIS